MNIYYQMWLCLQKTGLKKKRKEKKRGGIFDHNSYDTWREGSLMQKSLFSNFQSINTILKKINP